MAQVRADELIILFDHDRPNGEPSRTIYTEFEYGNRYDYTDLGFGTVYYPAHYGEDIGQTTLSEGGGIDEAVRSMTEGFRGSPEHWSDLMNPVYGAAGVAVSVERIDMGEGFPALYRCNFEVLLVDRRIPKQQAEREGNPRRGDVCDKKIQPPIIGEAFVNGYSRGYRKNIDQRDGDKARRAVTEN